MLTHWANCNMNSELSLVQSASWDLDGDAGGPLSFDCNLAWVAEWHRHAVAIESGKESKHAPDRISISWVVKAKLSKEEEEAHQVPN